MNKENLKRGQELSSSIERLENQIKSLESASKFRDQAISLCDMVGRHVGSVASCWIDFDVLKVLAISKITKKLNEYKQEFEKL